MSQRRFYIGSFGGELPGERVIFSRDNDGSLIVMEGDVPNDHDGEPFVENVRRFAISRQTPAKRGEAYKAADPPQEAFAAAVVERLNAVPGGPWEAHEGQDYAVVMGPDETTDTASIRVSSGDLARLIAARMNGLPFA